MDNLGITEELHRLILRRRWVLWMLRNCKLGDYNISDGRNFMLSRRLTKWKPTWLERQRVTIR